MRRDGGISNETFVVTGPSCFLLASEDASEVLVLPPSYLLVSTMIDCTLEEDMEDMATICGER